MFQNKTASAISSVCLLIAAFGVGRISKSDSHFINAVGSEISTSSRPQIYYETRIYEIFQRVASVDAESVVLLRDPATHEIIPLLMFVPQGTLGKHGFDTAAFVRVTGYNRDNMSAKQIQLVHVGTTSPPKS